LSLNNNLQYNLETVITMSIDDALAEWQSKKRTMGCVNAAEWFCKRVDGFKPLRTRKYMQNGNDQNGMFWDHVVCTNGKITIDISPYADYPRE
jgi:hypothetical protein